MLAGQALKPIGFPAGTERTWLLTYTDADTRIVRAGVDGGRSTARELGLIKKGEGEAADAYLFVLTRAPAAEAMPPSNPLAAAQKFVEARSARDQLKAELRAAMAGQRLGADATTADIERVGGLMEKLAELNPTADPAASEKLCGTWEIEWTTESELIGFTSSLDDVEWATSADGPGFTSSAYQTITRQSGGGGGGGSGSGGKWIYSLQNAIDFEGGYPLPLLPDREIPLSGYLRVVCAQPGASNLTAGPRNDSFADRESPRALAPPAGLNMLT